ncbi:hypothetical protein ACQ4PT_062001 [Festuca glaucescens]
MQKTKRKRRSKGITCWNEKKIASKKAFTQHITFEDGFGKSCQSSSSVLTKQIVSEVSESVVSLASFIGDTVLFECTGIFIENLCADATSILTSLNIVGSSDFEITDNLRIKVRLPSDRIVIGWLHHCDYEYDLAVVNVRRARGFREAHISSSHCVQSNGKVIAVRRCFNSGMLKTTNGIAIGSASDELCELMLSTYKINTAWIGCPFIDFDGNFVGLNLRSGGRTSFVPMDKILECLRFSGALRSVIRDLQYLQAVASLVGFITIFVLPLSYHTFLSDLIAVLDAKQYLTFAQVGSNQVGFGTNKPSTTKAHNAVMSPNDVFQMHVKYSFEEEFEDNIWSTLSEDVASTMFECVVSLASFDGDARCFACTGVFVGCNPMRILTSASLVRTSGDGNKIDRNLRIQVYLNNKRHVIGTLKHYDLHYNVAVVEIMGSCSSRAMELEKHIPFIPNSEVVAVGCLFEHRKLMASRGVLINRKSQLSCEELRISTCEITKAGIGGPLIDTCGNFIGMNFFHEEETPYLPREIIQEVLGYSDDEWHNATDTNDEGCSDSWPVPKQCWVYPPFCVGRDLRFETEEEANAAFPPQFLVDQQVYFGTEEEAYRPITSMEWC